MSDQITCSLNPIYAARANAKFLAWFSSCSHTLFFYCMRLFCCSMGKRYVIKAVLPRLFSVLWPGDLYFVFLFPTVHSFHALFSFDPFLCFSGFWYLEICVMSVITNPHFSAGMLPHLSINLCIRVCLFFQLLLFGIALLLYAFLRNLAEN